MDPARIASAIPEPWTRDVNTKTKRLLASCMTEFNIKNLRFKY
jgi:hypothetical protein